MNSLNPIIEKFPEIKNVESVKPLTAGLINQTYLVTTQEGTPNFILQCINHNIFKNVDLLQNNIECVTGHIRKKLEAAGEKDIDRKVLRFAVADNGKTYYFDKLPVKRILIGKSFVLLWLIMVKHIISMEKSTGVRVCSLKARLHSMLLHRSLHILSD